jgi:hypothetical protein
MVTCPYCSHVIPNRSAFAEIPKMNLGRFFCRGCDAEFFVVGDNIYTADQYIAMVRIPYPHQAS